MPDSQLFKAPDWGVHTTILFRYEVGHPGTGAIVSTVTPRALEVRETTFLDTAELRITFLLDLANNRAQVTLSSKSDPPRIDKHRFHLTPEFQTKPEVSLTVLYEQWKIIAVIDGKPLLVHLDE